MGAALRTRGALPPRQKLPRVFLTVLAIAKNELGAFPEWLAHYRAQGVNRFVIVDNGSTDGSVPYLQSQSDVVVHKDPTRHAQVLLYNKHAFHADESAWVLVVDLDEFMFGTVGTIANVLARLPPTVGAVTVPWTMFGSNGHIAQPAVGIRAGFTRRQAYPEEVSIETKYVFRPEAVHSLLIHTLYKRPRFITADEQLQPRELDPVDTPYAPQSEARLQTAALRLNHYAIQSWEFFQRVKMGRGSASTKEYDSVRTAEYFAERDHNDVEDTSILQ